MSVVAAVAVSADWLWAGGAALLLLAILAGFVAGVICAPALQHWSLRRTSRSLARLHEATCAQLERTEQICRQWSRLSHAALSAPQWSRLDELAQRLHAAWEAIGEQHRPRELAAMGADSEPFALEWLRGSVDPVTQLPDRAALEENLQHLLATSTTHRYPSGLLLATLDKGDQLRRRFGAEAAATLEAKLATVLIKAARNEDLVCRVGLDAFAVLLPSVSPLAGARIAETLRSAVRQHRFHVSDAGPEVVVTASFGYAACLPGDPASLVLDRAGAALTKSQACGRNQLHVQDAEQSGVCRVG
jgi:diguanylate cyclase (GGDEF)-like protein